LQEAFGVFLIEGTYTEDIILEKSTDDDEALKNVLLTEVFKLKRTFKILKPQGAPLYPNLNKSTKPLLMVPQGTVFESSTVVRSDNNIYFVKYFHIDSIDDSEIAISNDESNIKTPSSENNLPQEGWLPISELTEVTTTLDQERNEAEYIIKRELSELKERALVVKPFVKNKSKLYTF